MAILLMLILASSIFFAHNIQATASISVTYEFETPIVEETEGFHRVTIEGLYNLYEPDKPVLPFGLARILLPQGHEIGSISVEVGEKQVLGEGFNVEIGKEPEHTYHTGTVVDYYSTFTGTYPETYFELLRTQVHKGYEIAFIRLYPVHYNGQSGRITYINEMIVTMTTISAKKGLANTFRGLRKDSEEVRSMVDNPWTMDTYTQEARNPSRLPPGSYDYVIITSDALQTTFQNLANHKNGRGISTTIVTTSYIYSNYGGTDNQDQIRNFIIDAYSNWNITYVLLGGDVEIIPHRGMYGTCSGYTDNDIPCDLYYAGLNGNWDNDGDGIYGEGPGGGGGAAGEEADLTYEVYIGRAPVSNTTEAANFINKTIAFESVAAPQKASMWGEKLWSSPDTWGGDHKDETKAYFPGSYSISTYYDRDGTASTANWIASVNAGQNFVDHAAHSNPNTMGKIDRADVDGSITNTSNFCLIYSWGCYAASFDNRWSSGWYDPNDCIAEHFVNNSTGAFAFVGNSRYGWFSSGSTYGTSHQFDKEFFDAIFNEDILNAGETLADSKQDLQGSVGYTGSYRWVYFELNLLGDPETPLLGKQALLTSSISAIPIQVSSGQQITVTMTVQNTGGAQANNVTPSVLTANTTGTASATLLTGPTPASTNIPASSSQSFTWTYIANSGANGGTISFTGNATGTDAGTGNPVSSTATTSNTVTVQVPAAINANLTTNLSIVSSGQNVTVNMVVSNTGQATANNVTPSALTVNTTGTASALYTSGPTPGSANIPGGTSATFSWIYTCNSGTSGGTITFSGNATGTDANSGSPITSNTDSATVTVQTPANLISLLVATPAVVKPGDTITVTMTVQNTGQAGALNVTPSVLTVAGTGTVAPISGPVPASINIPGLSAQTFTWTYKAIGNGTVTFSGNATGTDANSGAVVISPVVASNTVIIRTPNPTPANRSNPNQQMRPVSQTHIKEAEDHIPYTEELIEEAKAEGKDTTECEELLEQAKEALEKAYMYFAGGNYIAANYWAMQAIEFLEKCRKCLENL